MITAIILTLVFIGLTLQFISFYFRSKYKYYKEIIELKKLRNAFFFRAGGDNYGMCSALQKFPEFQKHKDKIESQRTTPKYNAFWFYTKAERINALTTLIRYYKEKKD